MRTTVSPVRNADWRFLLPAPNGEAFGHLLLLGGTPQLQATLLELGVARRVSRSVRAGDTADALVILAGAGGPIDLAIEQLEAHGVLYWEVDRRTAGDLTLTPARAMRRLAEHGLTPDLAYWVKPGFPDRHMYVPVDSPGAVTWYLDTLYRAKGLPRRLFGAALRLLAHHADGIA